MSLHSLTKRGEGTGTKVESLDPVLILLSYHGLINGVDSKC